ncbi:hypothetical protein CYMTET_20861 [Cymbomonas tetramitiformis]|uniref:Calcineurin-like phosphoesterase domain-containing protein n=1 Tax=Cymbomonas tetramitiformis TaxID=36881 RepID=A0AAE0L3K4_9CHLO|nr:hypothetical protein CYMTET_20861 [Cymbomonas tetramitiformis]
MKGEKRMHQLKGHGTHSNVKLCITALVLVVALLWVTYRKNDQGVTSSGSIIQLLPTATGESQRCPASPTWPDRCFRIVALSDTHGFHHSVQVPEGDVLVFAGDWTDGEYTTSAQVADFDAWMGLLPHPHKVTTTRPQLKKVAIPKGEVMITGSHDGMEGHGSKSRVEGTQVLVTHGPPMGVGDADDPNGNVGDGDLKQMLDDRRITPRLHIFGHFHGGRGHYQVGTVLHANVGVCSLQKTLASKPLAKLIVPLKSEMAILGMFLRRVRQTQGRMATPRKVRELWDGLHLAHRVLTMLATHELTTPVPEADLLDVFLSGLSAEVRKEAFEIAERKGTPLILLERTLPTSRRLALKYAIEAELYLSIQRDK